MRDLPNGNRPFVISDLRLRILAQMGSVLGALCAQGGAERRGGTQETCPATAPLDRLRQTAMAATESDDHPVASAAVNAGIDAKHEEPVEAPQAPEENAVIENDDNVRGEHSNNGNVVPEETTTPIEESEPKVEEEQQQDEPIMESQPEAGNELRALGPTPQITVDDDASISAAAAEAERTESIRTDQRSIYSNDHSISHMSPVKRKHTNNISHLNEAASISFLKSSFERLITIKEILKKHQTIVQKATTALEILRTNQMPPEELIFEPLKLACEQSAIEAKILALDCLSKIFTFNLFTKPIYWDYKNTSTNSSKKATTTTADLDTGLDVSIKEGKVLLIEAAINVIVSCYEGEGTDERVELQIIRGLTNAIVNESMPVHGKVLLQAIRQINNIFLISLSTINQGLAQAALIQIVDSVYDKVLALNNRKKSIKQQQEEQQQQNQSLQSDEQQPETDESRDLDDPNKMTLQELQDTSNDVVQLASDEIIGDDDELYVKDAFLVFRSMSSLASKVIDVESLDLRSHQVRVKLLSLHIIYSILKNYTEVFEDKDHLIFNKNSDETTILVDGIRKYLCLVISRNATSQLASVYEVTLDIYWLMIQNLRFEFKYEVPVFMDEIYFPLGEMKTSAPYQKRYILEVVRRICCDPKILVELYLNYDCDTSLPNLCEKIIDYLARLALIKVDGSIQNKKNFLAFQSTVKSLKDNSKVPELNSTRVSTTQINPDALLNFPNDYALKVVSIDCIVSFLHSLNAASASPLLIASSAEQSMVSLDELRSIASDARKRGNSVMSMPHSPMSHSDSNVTLKDKEHNEGDNTTQQFDTLKQRKTALIEGIKLFNFSPKKGITYLATNGFIDRSDPKSIAQFILDNELLDKAQIGEYLGGSKEENLAVMHAFVDLLDFKNVSFLDSLRDFLQHFRLPGESQVIDRFMLKFAEKYVNDNPNVFANADTVYVLSYSVIMLNTDQHSPQIKKRMTLEEFAKNNRGIDDGKDLDSKFIESVYSDIQNNEIILNSEQQLALIQDGTNVSQPPLLLANSLFGRDYAKEAYTKASLVLSKKTESTMISLGKNNKAKKNKFYSSDNLTNAVHVKSMFENLWMSLLAGLTPPFKEYDDEDIANVLLQGIRLSVHLSCIYGIDYARTSFIRALVQFTNINNPEDMKDKNIRAIYKLLEIAVEENSYMKTSWRDIFIVISQVERLRLLAQGVNSDALPDLLNARLSKNSIDIRRIQTESAANNGFFAAFGASRRQSNSHQALLHHLNQKLPIEMVQKINATELDVCMDKVFSKSNEIENDGIFDFVNGLVDVARDEIKSSESSDQPRMFCLQKMVDVCYYNMSRIRLQWSELWKVMNQEFNEFGCNSNSKVAIFAIDSLRQLSERFFNIEELSHFKFQKEFLRPFDYIILNNPNIEVKNMVLDCIKYLISKKASVIKSGWTTILETLGHVGFNEDDERFVLSGLSYVKQIMDKHFQAIEDENCFQELIDCLCEYCKNERFQKISLKSLAMINELVERFGVEIDKRIGDDNYLNQYWYPLLASFNNIIMEGTDLEVRSKALNFMFESLILHGNNFDEPFWEKICQELLFPIFDILKRHGDINFNQNEGLWVWLSSTLIQALRKMIQLFTTFFKELSPMMDGYLSLLISCICQDNDAISKIGIACLKDMIFENMKKFDDVQWGKIDVTFTELFELTSARELFELDPLKKSEKPLPAASDENEDEEEEEEEEVDEEEEINGKCYSDIDADNKQYSSQDIVIKCVLHLHMIQILSELFDNTEFYETIPYQKLIDLSKLLKESYEFARKFNEDYDLRVRLWNGGVVDKLPNLLKQETSAVGVYISVIFRLYCDDEKIDDATRASIVEILIPLSIALLKRNVEFEERQELRNLQSWMPVVIEVLQAVTELNTEDFRKVCPEIYGYAIALVTGSTTPTLREGLREFLARVGEVYVATGQQQQQQQQ